jgi:nitric oxide reductase subunit B
LTARAAGSAWTSEAGIDRFLRWGLVVTLVVVIAVLIYGTVMVHRERPPIPDRVVTPAGDTLYTKDTIIDGKGVFQRTDLMDFGSLYGNGAYFGPDWGTDYLHREGQLMRDYYAQ